ncbi:hypothetical protein SAMN05421788_106369 [Filimonas lacunae]|uniref:Uncharacterized protein n=1 Tax=Filimonas lacunae TaxID=477680 RepID=A0A1N7QSH6_9BACT|nr:hypothetical protein [Filimonas lacunae]SIT25729.1 hypothetical protein SAMN05421788_106369 [Filimonas lacunae]
MPKRIYLNNKTGKAITLVVDSDFSANEGTRLAAFIHALHNKRMEPGHITIPFGSGKWSKDDETDLNTLLLHMNIVKAGTAGSFRLPANRKVGRGIFIQELIVTVKEP